MKQKPPAAAVPGPRTVRKHSAILTAAEALFLEHGYERTSMDDVAASAGVSKQTVYSHFARKEQLFIAVVQAMTGAAAADIHLELADIDRDNDPAVRLLAFAERQLRIVMTPDLMRLRRLIISEASRFPELGAALFANGPGRAIRVLAEAIAEWSRRGLLGDCDPVLAATQLNWLLMGEPTNRAMMLGNSGIPKPAALRRHAAETVRVFMAAYRP